MNFIRFADTFLKYRKYVPVVGEEVVVVERDLRVVWGTVIELGAGLVEMMFAW